MKYTNYMIDLITFYASINSFYINSGLYYHMKKDINTKSKDKYLHYYEKVKYFVDNNQLKIKVPELK